MFVLGNLIDAIAGIIDGLLYLYGWVVLIAVIMTWFNPDPFNPLVQFFRRATEPLFKVFRKFLPFLIVGQLDLTPLAVWLVIYFLRSFLVRTLIEMAARLHS